MTNEKKTKSIEKSALNDFFFGFFISPENSFSSMNVAGWAIDSFRQLNSINEWNSWYDNVFR